MKTTPAYFKEGKCFLGVLPEIVLPSFNEHQKLLDSFLELKEEKDKWKVKQLAYWTSKQAGYMSIESWQPEPNKLYLVEVEVEVRGYCSGYKDKVCGSKCITCPHDCIDYAFLIEEKIQHPGFVNGYSSHPKEESQDDLAQVISAMVILNLKGTGTWQFESGKFIQELKSKFTITRNDNE